MDILVTKRLTLRPPLEVDAEALYRHFQNQNVTRNLGRPPHPYTLEHAVEFVEKFAERTDHCTFTIHRERLIGGIGVDSREGEEIPSLGYWLAEPWWGKGYISEAARAVIAYAFRRFDCDRIAADAIDDNPGSLRVLEKLGFRVVGAGTLFQAVRDCEVATVKTELTRDAFEARFGSLENGMAA